VTHIRYLPRMNADNEQTNSKWEVKENERCCQCLILAEGIRGIHTAGAHMFNGRCRFKSFLCLFFQKRKKESEPRVGNTRGITTSHYGLNTAKKSVAGVNKHKGFK
jgi:hypothetical protein